MLLIMLEVLLDVAYTQPHFLFLYFIFKNFFMSLVAMKTIGLASFVTVHDLLCLLY